MNLFHNKSLQGGCGAAKSQSGFTMIEIALCLAIIGFAMVAIIGVMPAGLNVQRNNRDDTIINQEGNFFLEAIRNGNRGLDELANYVDDITIGRTNAAGLGSFTRIPINVITNNNSIPGAAIMGILNTPKYEIFQGRWFTNTVIAKVRAMSGSAAEKNNISKDVAFSYLLQSEITPFMMYPPDIKLDPPISSYTNFTAYGLSKADRLDRSNRWVQASFMATNLHELKLTLRWPVYQSTTAQGSSWRAGGNVKVFRTLISGRLIQATNVNISKQLIPLYFVSPAKYSR